MGRDHGHADHSELSGVEQRVRALETVLTEKGYIDPAALDVLIDTYQTKVGPRKAHVSSRAPGQTAPIAIGCGAMRPARSRSSATPAEGEHMIAVENTHRRHNVVVCTLCSCYPWPVLGLPPVWYKSAPYRSRVVKDPRAVLLEFGVTLPADTELRVWDSSAEVRYLVIPERPAGTERLEEQALSALVTRDSMIGTGLPHRRGELTCLLTHADLGGRPGFGPVVPEAEGPVFHAEWEARVLALSLAMGAAGSWNLDVSLRARDAAGLPPSQLLRNLAGRAGKTACCDGSRCERRTRRRPGTASTAADRYGPEGGSGRRATCTRLGDGAPADRPGALPGGPTRPHACDAGRSPHTDARLPSRQDRYGRTRPRFARICRFACPRPGRRPQWLYTVVFDELGHRVSFDAWQPYLEPA